MGISAIGVYKDTFKDLRALVAEKLGVPIEAVTPDAELVEELGADVFALIELILAIEDAFIGVEITDDDIEQVKLVSDLLWYVEANARGSTVNRIGAYAFGGGGVSQAR